jgi:oxygen-independent coproporphyrinogen-3 oxidase
MTALPGQTAGKIRETVRQYAALPVKHISAYMLKIEEGTPFYEEGISLPDDDRSADIYLAADEELSRAGFERYEISNFAKQGFESRHNTKYWHCCEVIGIGPGAHSFQKGVRTACYADLERFIREERQPEYLVDEAAGSAEERLMLGLRLTEGVSLSEYGIKENRQINDLRDHGLIKIAEGRLSLTSAGALVSNAVICRIIENINI